MKVLLYLNPTMFLDGIYFVLSDTHEKTPIEKLYLTGGTEASRERLHMWCVEKNIPTETLAVNWTKYGFSAFNKAVNAVIKDVKLVIIPHIDANTIDLSHIARVENVPIISLPTYGY